MSELEWLEIFGDNLIGYLGEARMTQKELAAAAGLPASCISSYIHKQRMPTLKAIINISYALDIDVGDLIDFGDKIY